MVAFVTKVTYAYIVDIMIAMVKTVTTAFMIQLLALLPVKDVSWLPLLPWLSGLPLFTGYCGYTKDLKSFRSAEFSCLVFLLLNLVVVLFPLTVSMWPSYAAHNLLRPGYLKRESIISYLYNHIDMG